VATSKTTPSAVSRRALRGGLAGSHVRVQGKVEAVAATYRADLLPSSRPVVPRSAALVP